MEIKDLQREVLDAERLAERGHMVLNLNQQVIELKATVGRLEKEVAELKATKEEVDGD